MIAGRPTWRTSVTNRSAGELQARGARGGVGGAELEGVCVPLRDLSDERRAVGLEQGEGAVLEAGGSLEGLLLALGVDDPGEGAVLLQGQVDRHVGRGPGLPVAGEGGGRG